MTLYLQQLKVPMPDHEPVCRTNADAFIYSTSLKTNENEFLSTIPKNFSLVCSLALFKLNKTRKRELGYP